MSEPYAGLPKRQHYVPQFLLRHFATGKNEQVHVFDKLTGRTFCTAVGNVASEKDYYNVPHQEVIRIWETARAAGLNVGDPPDDVSLEPSLGTLEGAAATAIGLIREGQSLGRLNAAARHSLALFVTVQFLRGPRQRSMVRQLHSKLAGILGDLAESHGADREAALRQAGLGETGGHDDVSLSLELVMDAPSFLPYFLGREWVLFRSPPGHAFLIGDNPAILTPLHPGQDHGVFCGLGLSSPDGQLMMPVSPDLGLLMLPQTWTAQLRRVAANFRKIREAGLTEPDNPFVEIVETALDTGEAIDFTPDNVLHNNHLQIWHAERYVYAAADDFELVRSVIAKDPKVREGPRILFG